MAAVVRGGSDDAARSRLRSGFDTGDADLLTTFDRLSQGRLKVFAGVRLLRCPSTAWHVCEVHAANMGIALKSSHHARLSQQGISQCVASAKSWHCTLMGHVRD